MTVQIARDIFRRTMTVSRVILPLAQDPAQETLSIDSPLGWIDIAFGAGGVCRLRFREQEWEAARSSWKPRQDPSRNAPASSPRARRVREAFEAYFRGQLEALDRVPVDAPGTVFQQHVWRVLRTVRAGTTVSYQELAARAGAPRAVRAVGGCNARNQVAIVIPCHRVIGADGKLTGYGPGLPRKRWLLDHEGATRSLWTPAAAPAPVG